MSATLPVSNYVSVAINLAASSAQAQSLNTLLILEDTPVVDPVERLRQYTSIGDIAADYGTTGSIYSSALLYFSQVPQPSSIYVGRWAKANAAGGLRCAPLSTANQAISVWNAITAGSFKVSINGGAATNITGLNFSAAANLSAVAAAIQTAMTGVTVSWNSIYDRFEFVSNTPGATSAISFLQATGSGTDISALLGGTSTSSGAYVYAGINAESAATAVALFESNYGQQWYALTMPSAADDDHMAVAAYIEAAGTRHVYGVSTQAAGCLVPNDTSNIGYRLKAAGYKKTMWQWSSYSAYSVASLIGRSITTDFTANNTVIDVMYKQEPGLQAENLNTTQANALKAINGNAFVSVNNGTTIIQYGNMASGDPIDLITGTDWLAITLQNTCYNLLYAATTKIPQTEAGSNQLVNACESVLIQAVDNGFLGPGTWTNNGFGILKQNQFLPKGFYVYAMPLSQQSQADRDARKAPPIQIAAKTAGAFRSIDIQVTVNR